MRRCWASLIIREMELKTTMRYHLTLPRMAVIKNKQKRTEKREVLVRLWRNWNPRALLMGVSNGAASIENSTVRPQTLKIKLPHDPASPVLGRYPKEPKARSCRDKCTCVLTAAPFPTAERQEHPVSIHQQVSG